MHDEVLDFFKKKRFPMAILKFLIFYFKITQPTQTESFYF